jgi:hypothetical protein
MPEDDLVLLKFSAQEASSALKWEHAEEFEFRDEKYDVVRSEQKGDSIFYWCWHDHKETQLSNKLDDLIAQTFSNKKEDHQQRARFNQFFKTLCFSQFDIPIKSTSEQFNKQGFHYCYSFRCYIKELVSPPPKLA